MMRRLSVSNIAWPTESRQTIYELLRNLGVQGVEVAPSKIAPWDRLDEKVIKAERDLMESFGLSVSSYQALYFGRPDLQLLGDEASFEELRSHTIRVARLAESLSGGGAGVFGAPKNRIRGGLTEEEAAKLGAERLARLADSVAPYDFVLVLEAAPEEYGGDFLQTAAACAKMVETVGHSALRLHLDTGCLEITGEDGKSFISDNSHLLRHVHLSRPQLAAVDSSAQPLLSQISSQLDAIGYDKWVAIEMRETRDFVSCITNAIEAVCADTTRQGTRNIKYP
jgi:sugar phosphate isomerase/epimerase